MAKPFDIPLRIHLIKPPVGIAFSVQRGSVNVAGDGARVSDGSDLSFDLSILITPTDGNGVRITGPYVQGPTTDKFFYVNSGTLAGQADSCITRRAKVPLGGITADLVAQVGATAGSRLTSAIEGTAKDGKPVCASIKLARGWEVEHE